MGGDVRCPDERGAVLVELALVLPILVTLVLGMVSSGVAYQRKMSLAHGSREASRYGATLPVSNFGSLDGWLDAIGERAIADGDGELGAGAPGRSVCVAYVHPAGTAATPLDRTSSKTVTATGDFASTAPSTTPCFADGRPAGERRVQVEVARHTTIEALVFQRVVTLRERSVTRFEAFLDPG